MRPCRRSPPARRSRCVLDLNGLGRYPTSTEAALYYCCSEALQNAAKHGGPATSVTVTAHADEQTLNLVISDTGRGFDPATIGTGLTNMTDRLSAIGGQLVIDTGRQDPPGHPHHRQSSTPRPLTRVGGVHTTVNRVAHTVVKRVPPQQDGTTSSKISGWQHVR